MNKQISKHWPWVTTAFLACLLWIQTCNVSNLKEDKEEQAAQITQLDLDKQELKTLNNRQGETIQRQKTIITTSQSAINNLTDTIFDLKKKDAKNTQTIAYWKGVSKTIIDTLEVPYVDRGKMRRFSDSIMEACNEVIQYMQDNTIVVPAVAAYSDPNISFRSTILQEGLRIDTLVIPDTIQLRFVEKKGGLFKRSTIEVQYFHSNPYVQNEFANSVFYKPKRKSFFRRVVLPVAAGVGAGILISK